MSATANPKHIFTLHVPSGTQWMDELQKLESAALHQIETVGDEQSALIALEAGQEAVLRTEASLRPVRLWPASRQDVPPGLVLTAIGGPMLPGLLHELAEIMAQHGSRIRRLRQLSDDGPFAWELYFDPPTTEASQRVLQRTLLEEMHDYDLEAAIQRDDPHRMRRRLVVMDMDSTLIRMEVIDELARVAGVGESVAAITRAAMAGDMDYDESLKRRVALLQGLDAAVLDDIARRLPLSPGVGRLTRGLKALGCRTAVLSGGFDRPARALQQQLGLDEAHSNVLEVQDGRLTGRVSGRIVNGEEKARLLTRLAAEAGIPLSQTVAIGDGANDLPMIRLAGLGVAWHGKAKLRAEADGALHQQLDHLLYLLGLTASEQRQLIG